MKGKIYRGRVAAIVVISLALYLVGLAGYLISGAYTTVGDMAGEVRISAVVKSEVRINPVEITNLLKEIKGVRAVEYVDSNSAERELSELFDKDIKRLMGSNVLPSIFLITINSSYALPSQIDSLKESIAQQPWVEKLYFEDALKTQVDKSAKMIEELLFAIGVVVGVVALLIIILAVRLSIGATLNCYEASSYHLVKRETLKWSLIAGMSSGVVASLLLFFTVRASHMALPISLEMNYGEVPMIAAMLIIVSTIITLLSTVIWLPMLRK